MKRDVFTASWPSENFVLDHMHRGCDLLLVHGMQLFERKKRARRFRGELPAPVLMDGIDFGPEDATMIEPPE